MGLESYFKEGKVLVWPERFAIVKAKKPLAGALAVIKDKNEITVIIDQSKIKGQKDILAIDKNWKMLSFNLVLPLNLVGFLAKISRALAQASISIFVISAYSTDHLLIKEKDSTKAIKILQNLGFRIVK